ncbi:hypothetical protein ACWGA0_02155 [Streptomyces erythrochromogenes]
MFLRIDRHGRINPPMHRAGLAVRPGDVLPDGAPRWTGHSSPRLGRGHPPRREGPPRASRHGGWADGSRVFAGYHDRAAAFDEELNPLYGIACSPLSERRCFPSPQLAGSATEVR